MTATELGVERAAHRTRALRAADAAWLAALPCALLTVAIVALLGPPLGRAFLAPGAEAFWLAAPNVLPEPEEHGRYLLALLGPVLLVGAVVASARRSLGAAPAVTRGGVLATQLVLVAFIALCFAAQNDVLLSAYLVDWEEPVHTRYFTLPTLLVALALPALLLALMRRRAVAARIAGLARETPARRAAALVLAILFTATWLLTAIDADSSLLNTAIGVAGHILWSMDETFAILNGRTPLVDFHAQYGQLWPYAVAGAMSVLGTSLGIYTTLMVIGSAAGLLAVLALLRRIVRSSLLALALYLPWVATGFFMKIGPPEDRYGPANLYSLWPVRYAGPYVLAWLLIRHLDGAGPRRVWLLFGAAGLVLINNVEFGAAAVAALAAGLVAARPPRSREDATRLLVQATSGLLGAVVLVTLLTLMRSGSLPHFGWALEFTRIYGIGGLEMLPMPTIGIYLVVYLTFTAAIALATVRVLRREPDRLLTAMLAWSGVFGMLAGGYFAGRSHPQVLIDLFSPWGLSLILLTIAAARALAARDWRRPTLPELALLFCFGLLVCSLPQTPAPWSQIARITDRAAVAVFKQPAASAFVAERTRPGERIAILIPLGHRIAYDIGRVDVAPYASIESMPTVQQFDRMVAVVHREGASKVFVEDKLMLGEELDALQQTGFTRRAEITEERGAHIIEMTTQD